MRMMLQFLSSLGGKGGGGCWDECVLGPPLFFFKNKYFNYLFAVIFSVCMSTTVYPKNTCIYIYLYKYICINISIYI